MTIYLSRASTTLEYHHESHLRQTIIPSRLFHTQPKGSKKHCVQHWQRFIQSAISPLNKQPFLNIFDVVPPPHISVDQPSSILQHLKQHTTAIPLRGTRKYIPGVIDDLRRLHTAIDYRIPARRSLAAPISFWRFGKGLILPKESLIHPRDPVNFGIGIF